MIAIAEISGADSVAAVLAYTKAHPHVRHVVPTYASTGTEWGDFSQIEANVAFLRNELALRSGAVLDDLVHLGDPALWRALNGRPASALIRRYGMWLPCIGCHLYLHLLRIPLTRDVGATMIISGERERHGERVKANQRPDALDAYTAVLGHAGIELALPVRAVADRGELDTLLGERWPGGSPQLQCVLSGNDRSLADGSLTPTPHGLIDTYVVPAGIGIAEELLSGRTDFDAVVAEVLRDAGAGEPA